MEEARDRLIGLAEAGNRFDIPHDQIADAQLQAIDALFQDRRDRIKLLGHRAREAGIDAVRTLADVVPLLFPHTAYKSYPESFLIEGKWDRLIKWLGTISPYPIAAIDTADIADIDDWIARLQAAGHFISCSSGTTGKSAMLIASERDMAWSRVDTVQAFAWGSGVTPLQDRKMIGCAPVAAVAKNIIIGQAQYDAFSDPKWPRFDYPVPPITVGALTRMVVMRKTIADGSARPEEIADFERTSRERQAVVDAAIDLTADAVIENRDKKLYVSGLWSGLYAVAKTVRERGFGAADFHPDNCIYVGGGLKRALLPDDYQAVVHETFNIPPGRHFQNYSMQELNSAMPKCQRGGRYHVPPWIVPLILNKDGDALAPYVEGEEIEGRAAFFDLSLDGRWGGVITGDKIALDYRPCACGHAGPSIRDDIVRYADLEGDDKIGCAGTVDAYVRGVS
ncbi:hypothetical protein [Caulobacter soli]|uniref:hypothetical protein n=1 Tax=Caulobacter soli TaxID=2708539 RepID=UPI0013EC1A49|nr:hypothetical protein [Caulobacter soli]